MTNYIETKAKYEKRLKQRPSDELKTLALEHQYGNDFQSIEVYRLYREKVVHEDTLINFRTSWFVALQAFLFSALAFASTRASGDAPVLLIILFSIVGIATAGGTYISVRAASMAIDKTALKWQSRYYDKLNDRYLEKGVRDIVDPMGVLPAIKGGGGDGTIAIRGSLLSLGLPIVVGVFWVVLFMASMMKAEDCAPFQKNWLNCTIENELVQ